MMEFCANSSTCAQQKSTCSFTSYSRSYASNGKIASCCGTEYQLRSICTLFYSFNSKGDRSTRIHGWSGTLVPIVDRLWPKHRPSRSQGSNIASKTLNNSIYTSLKLRWSFEEIVFDLHTHQCAPQGSFLAVQLTRLSWAHFLNKSLMRFQNLITMVVINRKSGVWVIYLGSEWDFW